MGTEDESAADRAWRRYRHAHRWLLWSSAGLVYGVFCAIEPARFHLVSAIGLNEFVLLNSRGGFFLAIAAALGAWFNWLQRRETLRAWEAAVMTERT